MLPCASLIVSPKLQNCSTRRCEGRVSCRLYGGTSVAARCIRKTVVLRVKSDFQHEFLKSLHPVGCIVRDSD